MLSLKMRLSIFFVLMGVTAAAGLAQEREAWRSQAIVHVDGSAVARMRGVPVSAVKLGPGFWTERRRVVTEVSVPTLYNEFEERGIFDNFRRLAGKKVARRGPLYTDSDVYKWMEAVAFEVQAGETRNQALLEEAIRIVSAAQEESGYLNTRYSLEGLGERHKNMLHGHELYCLGHLLQAGVAWYRATGKRDLMEVGIRFVRYLRERYGPGKEALFDGHPEIELALVELYRTTGDRSFLDFAGYFLNSDSRLKGRISARDQVYTYTGKPFTERTQMEGHAVRAGYAASGATDYYLETGDRAYRETLEKLWLDLAGSKVYITGGIGSRQTGEAFGEAFELPNQLAYTESCAAIANFFWNWRMLAATGDARHADLLERALYNGINSGLSLDGRLYCYRNPLELSGNPNDRIRNPWYDTTCCPPNLQRVLASLPGYLFGVTDAGIAVHLYHTAALNWRLKDGVAVEVRQETEYPRAGVVKLVVNPERETVFELALRIPGWSEKTEVLVNGERESDVRAGRYHGIRRAWRAGDRVELRLNLDVRHTLADPRVRDNVGKAAVERGPVVYCLEGVDQMPGVEAHTLALDLRGNAGAAVSISGESVGGLPVLEHRAVDLADEPVGLYSTRPAKRAWKPAAARLSPYFTFANRGFTPMQVWIPYIE